MKLSVDMLSSLAPAVRARGGAPSETAEAFRDFETLLIAEVLKGSEKPLGGSHALDGGSAGRMYREQFADAIAAGIARAGGLGIADRLQQQQDAKTGDDRG